MRPLVLTLMAAALIGIVLPGCGVGPAPGSGDDREPASRIEDSSGPGEETDGRELPEPPGSTLSYGGEIVDSGLGSYCWSSASGAVCTDSIGVPVSRETLTVPAGSALRFEYGGRGLESLGATAHRIGQGNHLEKAGRGSFLVLDEENEGYKGVELQTRRSDNRARIVADLPDGEYAVAVFARMPQGDALYGFHVVVE